MPLPKGIKPRYYQQDSYDNIREAFKTHNAVLAEAPTGSGKSVLMAMIVDSFLTLNKKWKLDRHLYFLVDEKFLLYQFSEHLSKWNISHDIIGDGCREGRDVQIHVCTIQTLSKYPPKRDPAFFIMDEAHLTTSPRYMNLFYKYPKTKKLGLTASPEQTNGKGLNAEWVNGKNMGNGIFDVLVDCTVTMKQLTFGVEETDASRVTVTNTYLSRVRYFGVPLKGVEALHIAGGDYKDKEIEQLLKDRGTFGNAINEMRKFPEIDKYILFFCRNTKACYEMETILHANGYTAEVLEGNLTKKQRKIVMKNFRTGKTQVLITCKMVQKGVDLPTLLMGVDIQPTPSRSLQRQKVGRFTRKSEGKEYAVFLDLVANFRVFPEYNIYADIEWNFKGKKYNKKPVGTGEEQVCPLCYALLKVGSNTCPECGAEKPPSKKKEKPIKNMKGDLVEIIPLKDRTAEDKSEITQKISKALIDQDIKTLYDIGLTLTDKRKVPLWIYYQLCEKKSVIDIPLLYRIQRQLGYKTSWIYFIKKQIRLEKGNSV